MLPFEIKEGPARRSPALKWARRRRVTLPDVQKAAAIETPAPYVAADVNDARIRIEDRYRRQGFNDAEVEAQPAIAPDDTVALTFTVIEGSQQVLQSVEITGNEVTRGKVLTQALRFELGQPVDLDEWALARKRLYDTNVFRLVDIQPVPVGDPVNGVQQVKAVVTVEETAGVVGALRVPDRRRAPARARRIHQHAQCRRRRRAPESEPVRPRADRRPVRHVSTQPQDASVFVATSRLFGWRARSTLYGFYSRDRLRDDAGVDIGDDRSQRESAPINAGGRAASRSSTAIASSAITRSIRRTLDDPFRSTSSPTSRS